MNGSIIRVDDCLPQRWKNGLGSTREIAAHTSAESPSDFIWRASLAEVDSSAPFSCFPGIDRHIVLLDGAGFSMVLDRDRTHPLTTPFEPFAFPGETKVAVQLAGGACHDFNLMVRRTLAHGEVAVWRRQGQHVLTPPTVLVYAARGQIDLPDGTLQPGDSWLPATPATERIVLHDDAIALVIRIQRSA